MKWYFERNEYLLNHETNKTFEELLWMSPEEFHQWCIDVRKAVIYAWDTLGIPPVVGKSESDFIDGVEKIIGYNTTEFAVSADDGNDDYASKDIIRNTQTELSGILGGFFPTIMKVKINYTTDSSKGVSIYDFFADDKLLPRFETYARRHFKRDSFYAFSSPVKSGDDTNIRDYPHATLGREWIEQFEDKYRRIGEWDYWLAPAEEENKYTGYKEELRDRVNLGVTDKDPIWTICPKRCQTNVDWSKSMYYQIRVFKKGQKVFPAGFKFWRISFCQVPAQFPPLTAKYLYERYTDDLVGNDRIVLYDPSAGWGGRLLGALAVTGRNIHYIGTDPNLDHNTTPGRTKYHEIADFVIQNTSKASNLVPDLTTYEIFQKGSEEIYKDPEFKKWKGRVDLVFTSPPYFSREKYSNSEGQSFARFAEYKDWREGFLVPTLATAYTWLKRNRFCLWNISDLKVGDKEFLPLEQDSIDIATKLGFRHTKTLKMTLAQMPGSGRVDADGKPKAKNSVKVDGKWMRFEPIFVFYKP